MFELQDGWTLYIWLISGAAILVGVVFGIRWASQNEQFDEDIKYLVFDEGDRDKMSPEEFAKSQQVNASQELRRKEVLAEREAAAREQN
ncbi:MAG: hypothetical protein CO186_02280 [Zetaproteobacteria bacterium CG_4_9_14_3_um_filter_49_83]|nr:MAG: hypothetical protein AUJ56_06325 [Zetaproteobacteria bacterium CG1_02_49_23]PIQ33436.1 MAG: hypothetical protein COW62_05045 [Zetaproteobacteria bacterium CG17_big_fil_post_rev_8_21_14_2_50_50_13]PIV29105.1 MAG: hypothetical protein COS35_13770 [Zetaproteobacteria bacterium CG02_land_8_20_14_3_00_50_9]PIY55643.1 MAG: hypothetical protein COZ00_08110 [Zetaproteobacteria bacterium CG_4_10_14_0_8_um_filter_49_80]PJA35993.1 MAG: hypothetical protein CO186_02280 [Zetaproteobacteria bacterium